VGDAVFLLGFAPLSFPHGSVGEDDEWGRTDHEILVSLLAGGVSAGVGTEPTDRKPRQKPTYNIR
jgi:hypothetical protein